MGERDAVMERWGRLDGLLVSVGSPPAGKALTIGDETWRAAFGSVFLGAVRLVRELSPAIADGGAIALVLAVSAKEAAPMIAISSGLRPGLGLLAKNFADELGPRHVGINALLPGMFATERMQHLFKDKAPDLSPVSLRRFGDPAEFGHMAAILLSPAASYVTGAGHRHRRRPDQDDVMNGATCRAVREVRVNQSFAIIRSHRGQT